MWTSTITLAVTLLIFFSLYMAITKCTPVLAARLRIGARRLIMSRRREHAKRPLAEDGDTSEDEDVPPESADVQDGVSVLSSRHGPNSKLTNRRQCETSCVYDV